MLPSEKNEKRRIGFESKLLNCNSSLYYFNTCPKLCKHCQHSVFVIYFVKPVAIYSFSSLPVLDDLVNEDYQLSTASHFTCAPHPLPKKIGGGEFVAVRVPRTLVTPTPL